MRCSVRSVSVSVDISSLYEKSRQHVSGGRQKMVKRSARAERSDCDDLNCRLNPSQLARQRKMNVFLPQRAALDLGAVAPLQVFDALLDNRLRGAGAGRNDHGFHALEPTIVDILSAIDQLRRNARFQGNFL